MLPSPYRNIIDPLWEYLDRLLSESPDTLINLLVPVIVTNEAFDQYLHNGAADQILRELRYSEGILVTEIPFYVNMSPQAGRVIASQVTSAHADRSA